MSAPVRPSAPLLGLILLLVGCHESSIPRPAEPVWPPEEGRYCGAAPDVCGDDGTPWVCGARPLWRPLDCATECAALGRETEGCLLVDIHARQALAAVALPSYDNGAAGVPAARCLCTPPDEVECPGPAHRACGDRQRLWVCDDALQWREERCVDQCQGLRPPLAADECEHGVAFGSPGTDGCRCTAVGTPYGDEGSFTCDDELVLGCEGGALKVLLSCRDAITCSYPTHAICDMAGRDDPPCLCTDS